MARLLLQVWDRLEEIVAREPHPFIYVSMPTAPSDRWAWSEPGVSVGFRHHDVHELQVRQAVLHGLPRGLPALQALRGAEMISVRDRRPWWRITPCG